MILSGSITGAVAKPSDTVESEASGVAATLPPLAVYAKHDLRGARAAGRTEQAAAQPADSKKG